MSGETGGEALDLRPLFDDETPAAEREATLARLEAEDPARASELRAALEVEALLEHVSVASRRFCPDRETLASAAFEELGVSAGARVERHAAACPLCAADLADIRALAAPTRLELALNFVGDALTLLHNSLGELLAPAEPALVRGAAAPAAQGGERAQWDIARDLGGAELNLAVRGVGGARAMLRVALRCEGAPAPFSALLFRDDQVIEGRTAEQGELTFEALEPGCYELELRGQGAAAAVDETLRVELGVGGDP